MALTVNISGDATANRNDLKTYTATVTGQRAGATLQYAWNASHGRFTGDTSGASVTWEAGLPGRDETAVTITCAASVEADPNPTSSGPSLTALAEIGITGILVNMYLTSIGTVSPKQNNILVDGSIGTLAPGSDTRLASDINIYRLRWDNRTNIPEKAFRLNNDGSGDLHAYFYGNTNQSVYLIFENGTYTELDLSDYVGGGPRSGRWEVASNIATLLDGLGAASELVVGVADAGSIGLDADSGQGSLAVTVSASTPPPDAMPNFGVATVSDIVATRGVAITGVTLPQASGGDAPLTYSIAPPLPAGLTFNPASRLLSGTPSEVLSRTRFAYTVSDADNDTDRIQFYLTVNAPGTPPVDPPVDPPVTPAGRKGAGFFLGQAVAFTRSGNVLSVDGSRVGAVHLNQTGYTQVRLRDGSLDRTYDLEDGWNLLTFPNVALTSITLTFTGTGRVDWTGAGVFEKDIELTDEQLRHRPRTYSPSFSVPAGGKFGTARQVVSEHGFEWRYLPWGRADRLELLFERLGALGNPQFVLIPDGFEGDRYDVVITSPFDFYPSVVGYFDGGASGALVFSSV